MIVYGTTEGHTKKISEFLKIEAVNSGHQVGLFDTLITPPSPDGFDAIVIASSMHVGKYHPAIVEYAETHHLKLNRMNSIFLSVSLTAAADEPESWKELKNQTEDFLLQTGWKPRSVEYVAGALLYTQYDYFKRFIMRLISKRSGGDTDTKKDHEYTDWDQVKRVIGKLESNTEV